MKLTKYFIIIFVIVMLIGCKKKTVKVNNYYTKSEVVELLGVFTKPFVLMVRLFANITAGHIIILSFVSLIFIFGQMSAGLGYGVSVVSMGFSIFMNFV